jgi:zinc and cadmium transporter
MLLTVYCVCVFLASLLGGRLPSLLHLTHRRMQILVSLVAGLMLGVGMFHLIPHAALAVRSVDRAMLWAMVGMLITFFLIRVFHFHEHAPAEQTDSERPAHEHDCGHDHDHTSEHQHHAPQQTHRFSWVGMALGLSIHTLLDGVALAASVHADSDGHSGFAFAGFGTFLAVCAHKPLDSMSITALMSAGGWSFGARRFVNTVYGLLCPLGAVLFWLGSRDLTEQPALFVGTALAFSGGVFLCIALSDLLPELQFHSHDQLKLSMALLLGVAVAWSIRYIEPAHVHDHSVHSPGTAPPAEHAPHAADEHSHPHDHAH